MYSTSLEFLLFGIPYHSRSVGLRHITKSVADNNQRVLVDLENINSARHVSGDSSHDCVFIDFGDNNS